MASHTFLTVITCIALLLGIWPRSITHAEQNLTCPLSTNTTVNTCLNPPYDTGLHIYCHQPLPRSIWRLWTSCEMVIEGVDDMVLFSGDDEESVKKRLNQVWFWLMPTLREHHPATISFPAFRKFCIGIEIPDTALSLHEPYYHFVFKVRGKLLPRMHLIHIRRKTPL